MVGLGNPLKQGLLVEDGFCRIKYFVIKNNIILMYPNAPKITWNESAELNGMEWPTNKACQTYKSSKGNRQSQDKSIFSFKQTVCETYYKEVLILYSLYVKTKTKTNLGIKIGSHRTNYGGFVLQIQRGNISGQTRPSQQFWPDPKLSTKQNDINKKYIKRS